MTGLPRPTAGSRCAPASVEHLLELAREQAEVVVDTGFSLEEDPAADFGGRPGRNQMTLGGARRAPTRSWWSAAPTRSGCPGWPGRWSSSASRSAGAPARVVVNRMRPTLGWSERDIAGMVSGFARPAGVHFLPEDQAAVDRALVAGRTAGRGPATPTSAASVARLVDALLPAPVTVPAQRGERHSATSQGRGRLPTFYRVGSR